MASLSMSLLKDVSCVDDIEIIVSPISDDVVVQIFVVSILSMNTRWHILPIGIS